jgi:hypothetical protein
VGLLVKGQPEDSAPQARTPAAAQPVALKPEVSSYTTSGTGFEPDGRAWATQTYNSVTFGNLKPGVGLILDLGSAKDVASVSFTAKTGPLTVELLSADEKPADLSGWKDAVKATSAPGATKTTFDASEAGKQRYWMIWVTKLGPDRKATISGISVLAKS